MKTAKMTREQMIEKLDSLHEGAKVLWNDKVYTVYGIGDPMGKLHRRDMNLLEEGKPAYYEVPGKYLAAGTMIQCDNLVFRSLYAQKAYMNFEIVG